MSLGADIASVAITAGRDVMFDRVRARLRLARLDDAGAVPTGINARGEIIGCGTSGAATRGYVWRDGSLTSIPPVAEQDHSCAHQIDQHGLVLARTYSSDPSMLDATKGHRWFLWMNGGITLLGSDDADSHPLLRNGRVLMNRWEGGPTIWEDGQVVELAPGDDPMTGLAMNEDGVVVGYWTDRAEGFVWDRGRTIRFQLPGGAGAVVTWMDIDENRRVLLTMGAPPKPEDHRAPGTKGYSAKAFVLTGSEVHELPSLGGAESHAAAFGTDGDILGWSTDGAGVRHAVRWTAAR